MPPKGGAPYGGSVIEITEPKRFNTLAVLVVTAFGVLGVLPILISFVIVSVMPLGVLTFLIPLLALGLAACFLPFASGNACIAMLVRRLNPSARNPANGFIVQLTLTPRIRYGLRALVEDADDIGFLTLTDKDLVFQGDSVKLSIPLSQIREVRRKMRGMRGVLVPRVVIVAPELQKFQSVEFGERSSWVLPTSREISTKLYEAMKSRVAI
jgi:hypothetical protein